MNLLHDIDPGTKEEMNVIIEIPKDSHNKYEIDKKTGLIKLDRANYSAAAYPFDYGFAPQTLWEDGDPLDALVITRSPIIPGAVIKVRPVGVLLMEDLAADRLPFAETAADLEAAVRTIAGSARSMGVDVEGLEG